MADLTKKAVQDKLEMVVKQLDQGLANLNALTGAKQAYELLLKEMDVAAPMSGKREMKRRLKMMAKQGKATHVATP